MDAFAIYRLPHTGHCTLVGQDGMPMALTSLTALNHEQGYVIAPFTVDESLPALLLRPDVVKQCSLDDVAAMQELLFHHDGKGLPLQPSSREDYHNDFCKFHHAFSSSGLHKLVLARSADVVHHGTNPVMLFVKACKAYPEAFVTLFSAPQCGTWLVATPEVLLTRDGGHWRTIALAGTMPYSEPLPQWSDKNVQEQAYVSRYIGDCLSHYSRDVSMNGPYTTRAGILAHLRTDFSFTINEDVAVGEVLDALHPTPAVCGFPKQEAHRFIMENETCDRGYFSGFSGPLNLDGNTAFFVSLRCMRIMEERYRLYAGGGILPQSVEDMEWRETAAKMQAMLSIIEEYSHELQ
ncbi:MAG: chorismate-binding protein [Muribaculaceae bacterium]|nr:chorismate-binding protein [Muribaculaceae bacterium]